MSSVWPRIRLGGDGSRRGAVAALEPGQPLLGLAEQARVLAARGELALDPVEVPEERVDLLEELVDELERRVVERALVGREGLDVPVYELAQHALDRVEDDAA